MGYYTAYYLKVDPKEIGALHRFRQEYKDAANAIDSEGYSKDTVKWYSARHDLIEFSTKFPNVLFTLTKEGEDKGDWYRIYVKNGLSQEARGVMTFEDYSPEKLA